MSLLINIFPLMWKFDTEDSINNPIRIRAFKILRGHTKSVQCVAAQNTGDMVRSIFFFWLYLLIFQYLKKNIDIYVGKMRFKVKLIISSFFSFLGPVGCFHMLRFVQVLGIARSSYGRQMTLKVMVIWCQLRREKGMIRLMNLNWRYGCFMLMLPLRY